MFNQENVWYWRLFINLLVGPEAPHREDRRSQCWAKSQKVINNIIANCTNTAIVFASITLNLTKRLIPIFSSNLWGLVFTLTRNLLLCRAVTPTWPTMIHISLKISKYSFQTVSPPHDQQWYNSYFILLSKYQTILLKPRHSLYWFNLCHSRNLKLFESNPTP